MRNLKALFVLITFIFTNLTPPNGWAQVLSSKADGSLITAVGLMPSPGRSVSLSAGFDLAHFKGMVIDPTDPFKFDFIIHQGDEQLDRNQKQQEYTKLIKYFLAALAVPDTDQWVNLSPYEKNRVIETDFGKTAMGRDLLAQDYLLKQLSSSLTNPDTGLGQKFWDQVYERVYKQFGRRDIPLNTFNKVWIIPDKAVIYEKGNMMYVIESHLKVMTEEDYLATKKHHQDQVMNDKSKAVGISNAVMRQVIIPAIEQEVNTGKNFAPLRQVLSGMLLATWYKRALKESILGKLYANKSKLNGINQDPKVNEKIFQEYIRAYKKGVYNMIREDADPVTQEVIPRKYFSGGFFNALALKGAIVNGTRAQAGDDFAQQSSAMVTVSTELTPPGDFRRMVNAIKLKATRVLKWVKPSLAAVISTGALVATNNAKGQAVGAAPFSYAFNYSADPTVVSYNEYDDDNPAELNNPQLLVNNGNTQNIGNTNMFTLDADTYPTNDIVYITITAQNSQGFQSSPANLVGASVRVVNQGPDEVSFPAGTVISSFNNSSSNLTNMVVNGSNVTYQANPGIGNFNVTTANGVLVNFQEIVMPTYTVYGAAPQLANLGALYGLSPAVITADIASGALTVTAGNPNMYAVQPSIDNNGNLNYVPNFVTGTDQITVLDTNPNNPLQVTVTVNVNPWPTMTFVPAAPITVGGSQFSKAVIQLNGGATNQIYNVTVLGGLPGVSLGTVKILGGQSFTWYNPNIAYQQSQIYSGVVTGLPPLVTPPLTAAEQKALMKKVAQLVINGDDGSINSSAALFPKFNFKEVKTGVEVAVNKPEPTSSYSPVFKFDYKNKTTPPTVTELGAPKKVEKSPFALAEVKHRRSNTRRGPFVNPRDVLPAKNIAGLNYPQKASHNAAMLDPGGIDFAQSNLDMQIKRDGQGMPLPMSQQNLDNIHIDGLVPVILDIKPVASSLGNIIEGSSLAASS